VPPPTWSVGEVLASADVNSWFVPLVAIKASDTSRSTTSQTNDPDLVITVAANATYEFRLWLNYEGPAQGTADLKLGLSVPASATARTSNTYVNSSGGSVVEGYYASGGTALVPGTNGSGNIRGFRMVGTLVTSSTSGSLALSWAQNTASGSTTIHTGSILKAWRVS
jgi:hypothetical protein